MAASTTVHTLIKMETKGKRHDLVVLQALNSVRAFQNPAWTVPYIFTANPVTDGNQTLLNAQLHLMYYFSVILTCV